MNDIMQGRFMNIISCCCCKRKITATFSEIICIYLTEEVCRFCWSIASRFQLYGQVAVIIRLLIMHKIHSRAWTLHDIHVRPIRLAFICCGSLSTQMLESCLRRRCLHACTESAECYPHKMCRRYLFTFFFSLFLSLRLPPSFR